MGAQAGGEQGTDTAIQVQKRGVRRVGPVISRTGIGGLVRGGLNQPSNDEDDLVHVHVCLVLQSATVCIVWVALSVAQVQHTCTSNIAGCVSATPLSPALDLEVQGKKQWGG